MSQQLADELMNTAVKKLNANKEKAVGFGKVVQIVFTDIAKGYKFAFAKDDGTVTMEKIPASQIKESDAAATMTLNKVETWKGIVDGSIDPREAMAEDLLQISGNLYATTKFQPAMH